MNIKRFIAKQKVRINRTGTYVSLLSLSFLVITKLKETFNIDYKISIPTAIITIYLAGYIDDKAGLHNAELSYRTEHNKYLHKIIKQK